MDPYQQITDDIINEIQGQFDSLDISDIITIEHIISDTLVKYNITTE
jgi:hypothetical protein